MPNLRMPQINYSVIAGRITRKPELRYISTETTVCELNVAVDIGYGEKKKAAFVGVVCWGKTAERVAELEKGSPVLVEGRIEQDQWDDKDTGKKRTKTKINAHRVQALTWPDDGEDTPGSYEPPRTGEQQPIPDDDIPF